MGLHHHLAQTPGATDEWPDFACRLNIERVHDCFLSSLQLSRTLSVIVTPDLRFDLCLTPLAFILHACVCFRFLCHATCVTFSTRLHCV